MIELGRSSVQTWECDTMGHMNVQFYVEKAHDAAGYLGIRLGRGPHAMAEVKQSLITVDQHVRFHREMRPGTPYFLRGGVARVEHGQVIAYIEMVQTVGEVVSATFTSTLQLRDQQGNTRHPFPTGLAKDYIVDIPGYGMARGLDLDAPPRRAPTLSEADGMGLMATYMARVRSQECDRFGRMQARFFMARYSDSIPNLLALTSGRNRGEPGSTGGAALEYRLIYRKFPRAGDILCIRSGLKSIAEKTYVWAHWMFDAETGECVATSEAVAVAMDLETRKAIPIPPELRARLEALRIGGLSA